MDALEELGIKEFVLAQTKPLKGKIIHFPDGRKTFLPYSTDTEEIAHCIQRK